MQTMKRRMAMGLTAAAAMIAATGLSGQARAADDIVLGAPCR